MTFIIVALVAVVVVTLTVTFATKEGAKEIAQDIMNQATNTVEIVEEVDVWALKPMNIMPQADGTFTMEEK